MIFNSKFQDKGDRGCSFKYNKESLKVRDAFVYLGTFMCDGDLLLRSKNAFTHRFNKAKRALYLMKGKCRCMGINNVETNLHLYEALVLSSLNFGCEIWGPALLNERDILNDHEVEKWHRMFLRQRLGVSKTTSTLCLMEELQRVPITIYWIKLVLGFWNRTMDKEESDLSFLAMRASLEGDWGWVKTMNMALNKLGSSVQLVDCVQVDVDDIIEEVVRKWKYSSRVNVCDMNIRDIDDNHRKRFKVIKYLKWFSRNPDMDMKSNYTSKLFSADQIRVIAKFRLSCHCLNCEHLRMIEGVNVPRSKRICGCCPFNKIEDEMHVFECPFYNDIRLEYYSLFQHLCRNVFQDDDMVVWNWEFSDDKFREFMNGDGDPSFWPKLANYLIACKKKRQSCIQVSI